MASTEYSVDVDLLIVGAGPVGLYGAYYAGFRGLSVAVIDARALTPETGHGVCDYAAFCRLSDV